VAATAVLRPRRGSRPRAARSRIRIRPSTRTPGAWEALSCMIVPVTIVEPAIRPLPARVRPESVQRPSVSFSLTSADSCPLGIPSVMPPARKAVAERPALPSRVESVLSNPTSTSKRGAARTRPASGHAKARAVRGPVNRGSPPRIATRSTASSPCPPHCPMRASGMAAITRPVKPLCRLPDPPRLKPSEP
jgi:hypothetical protein